MVVNRKDKKQNEKSSTVMKSLNFNDSTSSLTSDVVPVYRGNLTR